MSSARTPSLYETRLFLLVSWSDDCEPERSRCPAYRRGRGTARIRHGLLWPSPGALDAVLHRDVGTLQLLGEGGPPPPLHGGGAGRRWARVRRDERRGRIRAV